MEKAEELIAGSSFFNQGCTVSNKCVACLREFFNIVDIIFALGTRRRFRQEIGRAATQDHFRFNVIEHTDNISLIGTFAGMSNNRGGRCVFNFSVAHNTDGHLRLAANQFGDCFLFRIVLTCLGAVGINTQSVDA